MARRHSIPSLLAGSLLITLCYSGIPQPQVSAQERLIEAYAASVNDRVILISDVIGRMRSREAPLRKRYAGDELADQLEVLFRDSLTFLIENALILEEFESRETEFPERAIDEQMDEIIRERFNNSRGELLETLARGHITLTEWREDFIKEQLVVSVMRREVVGANVTISPNAARELYDQRIDRHQKPARAKLRIISVVKGTTPEDLVAKIEKIKLARDRVKMGDSFSLVAKEISEGSKAKDGGDWGWREPDALRREVAEVVTEIAPGTVSDIIVAKNQYYLVLVEAREKASIVPFEDVRKELGIELREVERKRIYDDWIARLQEKHHVKVFK
jgi:peptidyl-prolyl cis-trans isomerase SurA